MDVAGQASDGVGAVADSELDAKARRLLELLGSFDSLIVAFSGGVDSAYLAYAATEAIGSSVLCITADSPSYPDRHRQLALRIAREFHLPHEIIHTSELERPEYRANPVNRCYYCKHELYTALSRIAVERGFASVADGSNAGFLREDALLAVVILTDENDCSRRDNPVPITITDPFATTGASAADECNPADPNIEPVERFLGVLDTQTGDRGRWAAAVIGGPGPGTCSSEFGDAMEATRLREFVNNAGENAVFSSICDGDLSGSLMRALQTFQAACESFPPLI